MLEQASPEQSSGNSGPLPVGDRIANIFERHSRPEAAQPQQQSPQQETQAPQEHQEQEAPEVTAESEGEQQQAPAEETFELDLEGEKYVLPKKLEKSFMQERDYTQGKQSLADQRRAVEMKEQQFQIRELQQKFHTDVAAELKQMQMIDAVLEQPVNWQGMSTDEAFRHKIQLDDLKQQRDKLAAAVNQKHQTWQQQQSKAFQELQAKTIETLRSRIPSWNDATAKEVTDHYRARGLSDADFQVFNQNPAYIETAWKAMQFDKLQAKAKPAVQQAKQVKTTAANPMPQATKDYLAFRKATAKHAPGSPEHQRLIRERIAQKFTR